MSEKKICAWCMAQIDKETSQCPNCGYNGSQRNPTGALPLGTVLDGRYHIGRYLKIDGEGITYLAHDSETKEPLRIKEYYPPTLCQQRTQSMQVLSKPGKEVIFKTTMSDFADVYKNAAKYKDLENFMGVYGLAWENGTVYALRELSKGVTLAKYIENRGGFIDYNAAMSLLAPIFDAVQILHGDNMLHRGISPETILILPSGQAVLTGYATQAMRTKGSELSGTLYKGYTAPEQYDSAQYQGTFTDIYALAAVVYTCVSGRVPPQASERLHQDDLLLASREGAGKISVRQAEVLQGAMALEPSHRPQTVGALLDQLSGSYKPETRRPTQVRDMSAIQRQILMGVGVCAVAVLLLLLLLRGLFSDDPIGEGGSSSDSSYAQSSSEIVDKTKVDDFEGMLFSDIQANAELQRQYLFVTETEFSARYKVGEVIRQSPAAGSAYTPGQVITLVISKGAETVQVPNLRGETIERAREILNGLGIQFEIVPTMGNGSIPVGCVSGTDRMVGSELKIDSEKLIVYLVDSVPQSSEETSSSEEQSTPQDPGAGEEDNSGITDPDNN